MTEKIVEIDTHTIERILIIRLSALGDVIRTLPAFGLVRKRFPKAYIAWVVEELSAEILARKSDLDEVIVFPKTRIIDGLKHLRTIPGALADIVRFIARVRKNRFQLSLDFHGLFKSGVISFLSGAPLRVGFDKGFSKEMNHLFNNRRVTLPVPKMSRISRNLVLARYVAGDRAVPDVYIETSTEDKTAVDRLERSELLGSRPRIVVHPGTSKKTPYKKWGEEQFARAADLIISRVGGEVIITYGPGEEETALRMKDVMAEQAVLFSEPLTLGCLAELYRRSDLYVGGDTGPMHIASFVKTPVVAVFGPTDPVENEPYTRTPFRMVRAPVPCSPCRKRECTEKICFDGVTPERVADDAVSILTEGGKKADDFKSKMARKGKRKEKTKTEYQ
jgi:ADP-heptose:LPS heptosyltransferase